MSYETDLLNCQLAMKLLLFLDGRSGKFGCASSYFIYLINTNTVHPVQPVFPVKLLYHHNNLPSRKIVPLFSYGLLI